MKFNLIRNAIREEENKRLPNIETEEELKRELSFYNKSYIGTFTEQRKKILSLIVKRIGKAKEDKLKKIDEIENAKDFGGDFIITLEWKKSYMWGSNPRAYTNYGFVGSSIGGCGYDKTSTATAQALNSHNPILKLLLKKEEERLKFNADVETNNYYKAKKLDKKERRDFVGYGSGYYSIPKFEGGVGVSSHEGILKGLGLTMRSISNTDWTNVYLIRKMTEEEQTRFKEKGY